MTKIDMAILVVYVVGIFAIPILWGFFLGSGKSIGTLCERFYQEYIPLMLLSALWPVFLAIVLVGGIACCIGAFIGGIFYTLQSLGCLLHTYFENRRRAKRKSHDICKEN